MPLRLSDDKRKQTPLGIWKWLLKREILVQIIYFLIVSIEKCLICKIALLSDVIGDYPSVISKLRGVKEGSENSDVYQ